MLGVDFEVRPSAVEERQNPGEAAEAYVARLAREKAESVWAAGTGGPRPGPASGDAAWPAGTIILGCDTEVILDGVPLGKPSDDADAARMLRLMSGRAHDVVTAVCLLPTGQQHIERTRVWFSEMTDREIAEYVAGGEPRDKAGAYAIQGGAARFISRIEGCYYNVMGLPVAALYNLLLRETA